MSNIGNFISNHRSDFDDLEPKKGHFERFEARLYSSKPGKKIGMTRSYLLKIAAFLLLLITISVFVFDLTTRSFRSRMGLEFASTELPSEVNEAMQFYDGQAIFNLTEIAKLAGTNQQAKELSMAAKQELQSLDNNTAELKKAFSESPDNDRILSAMIQNQQMKEKVTNTILGKLNQLKK